MMRPSCYKALLFAASGVCILAEQWPLQTVIQFSCSCKEAAQLCKEQVIDNIARTFLERAVADACCQFKAAAAAKAAAKAAHHEEEQEECTNLLQQQVAWVVRQAGQHVLEGATMATLLGMPDVPAEFAAVLVRCGARFTFAQLLAAASAANSYRPDLKVWMKAYHVNGLERPDDMPAVAEAVCSAYDLTAELLVSSRL
jgi:hypothetical protein